ncbi:MAG: hypothetical protein EA408_13765 [Marinilabiliales bacterium]|nr:MAG: hypothetical protein EA408_13765 [Marinilabiliales bacterium]
MKTMTKKNVLKLATAALVFLFAANVVNAQSYPANINHTGDVGNYVQAVTETYQTVGFNFTLYVAPDPVYSPDYVGLEHDGTEDRGTGINEASEWRWVRGTDFDGTEVKAWTERENWVEITPALAGSPAAGNAVSFWVKERFGASGCEDSGAGREHIVNFVGLPQIQEFEGTATNGWEEQNGDFINCGPLEAVLSIEVLELGSIADLREYGYEIEVVRNYWDGTGWEPTSAVGNIIVEDETGYEHDIETVLLEYYNDGDDHTTEYLFTLADNSLTSRISSVSAIRAGDAIPSYAVPGTTVRYVVALAPTTGPIYHIPNNFEL